MGRLSLALLGSVQVLLGGEPLAPFPYDKVPALLAFLAVETDHPHRRETLATLLWPDQSDAAARHNLSQALLSLRRAIGDQDASSPHLVITRDTIRLNPSLDVEVDVAVFSALLAACDAHAHRHAETCRSCARRLADAVALYRGSFLQDLIVRDSALFEEWVLLKREAYHQRVLMALSRLAASYEREEAYEAAQQCARRQLELDPWREDAHRRLMRVLALSGQRSVALMQYERCRRVLQNDLGVEPDQETTALFERIRAEEEPTEGQPRRPAPRLPWPPTPLIGRQAELAELERRIEDPAVRLLTLLGPGGVGKTRLALQAALNQHATFRDGACFVPLAPVSSAEFLVPAIAASLGITFAQQGPADPREQLLDYLRERELLLLLDNIEHLLSQDDTWIDLLVAILEQAPRVALLVTSRERLRLQAEWNVELYGLPYPDDGSEDVDDYDAVRLFSQRARQAQAGFAPAAAERPAVTRICRLVEGLPLGIELAAAWVGARSCAELADELERNMLALASTYRDVPARHQSLRAVLDHSYALLAEEERQILRRLALFRGGFEAAAAEAVVAASPPLLTALIDASLLHNTRASDEAPRYDLHEVVRQYAGEQLQAAGETTQIRERHLAYYLQLAETAEPELKGPDQAAWLARLDAEHDNLRAALQACLDCGHAEAGLRLAGSLWRFWLRRGLLSEGRRWLEVAIRSAEAAALSRAGSAARWARAKAWHGAGALAMLQGDYAAARERYEASLALRRALGDRQGIADSLNALGLVADKQGDPAAAQDFHEESLTIKRELGDTWGTAVSLNNLGELAELRGDYIAAQRFHQEGLALRRALGDTWGIAASLGNLGTVAEAQGDYAVARACHEESLALRRELGDRQGVAYSLYNLGVVAQLQADYAVARIFHRDSLVLKRELGDKWGIAYSLEEFGALAAAQGQPERAVRLASAAAALREKLDTPLPAAHQAMLDGWLVPALAMLEDAARVAAWAKGKAIRLEQAIDYALAEGE